MRRGALVAAGGLAVPLWATWLSEQMEKLRPRRYISAPSSEIVIDDGQHWHFMTEATREVAEMLTRMKQQESGIRFHWALAK